jgi:hypothetical protein
MAISICMHIHSAGAELICAHAQTNVMKLVDAFCDCADTPTKNSVCGGSVLFSCLSVPRYQQLNCLADVSWNLLQGQFAHTNSCQASCMNFTGNQALSKDINEFLLSISKFFYHWYKSSSLWKISVQYCWTASVLWNSVQSQTLLRI